MKRDIGIAVMLGFVLGAIVALSATNLPQIIKEGIKRPVSRTSPTPSPAQITTAANMDFTIDSPKDGSIADDKTIDISVTGKSGQLILLESENDHKAGTIDSSGRKTTKFNLNEGVNLIYVTLYDTEGNSNTKTINVYYTTEKL